MRKTILFLTTVALAVLTPTVLSAQGPPPGGPPRGGSPSGMLLRRQDVRKDLALTAAQRAAVDKIVGPRSGPPPAPGGPRPDGQKLEALLTARQRTRLGQIRIQLVGAFAALDPKIGAAIGLTAVQKTQLAKLRPSGPPPGVPGQAGPPPGGPGRGGPPPGGPENGGDPMAAQSAKAAKLLSVTQRAKLKGLGGKPFARDSREERPGPPPPRF